MLPFYLSPLGTGRIASAASNVRVRPHFSRSERPSSSVSWKPVRHQPCGDWSTRCVNVIGIRASYQAPGDTVIDCKGIYHVSFVADHPGMHDRDHCITQSFCRDSLSAEIALALSRSSINMRICKSRAAHPRVNERAFALLIMVPRQMATIATWTEQLNTCFLMIISRLVLGKFIPRIALVCTRDRVRPLTSR